MADISAFEERALHACALVYDTVPHFAIGGAGSHQALPRPVLDREQRILIRRVQTHVRARALQNDRVNCVIIVNNSLVFKILYSSVKFKRLILKTKIQRW